MCYYVSVKTKANELVSTFNAPYTRAEEHVPYFLTNGFTHPLLPVLANDHGRSINLYQWGLIPFWVKSIEDAKKLTNQTLNAKAETIFEKPSFRDSIMTRRCIIPVTGFFEYKHEGKDKLPFYIYPKEQPYFNLAGIFSHWTDPSTRDEITTFSIITGHANELMASIHNTAKRMPLMIDDHLVNAWIDHTLPKSAVQELMQPCDDDRMAAFRVDRNLIKIGNQSAAIEEYSAV